MVYLLGELTRTHEVAILAYVDPNFYVSNSGRVVDAGRDVEKLQRNLRPLLESGEWRAKGHSGRVYNVGIILSRSC